MGPEEQASLAVSPRIKGNSTTRKGARHRAVGENQPLVDTPTCVPSPRLDSVVDTTSEHKTPPPAALEGLGPIYISKWFTDLASQSEFAKTMELVSDGSGRRWWIARAARSYSYIASCYFARAMLLALYEFDMCTSLFPVSEQLAYFHAARSWAESDFISHAKYVTAWPMARFLKNDAPPKPVTFTNHPLLVSGGLKRFIKSRLVSFSLRNASLFTSFLQGVKRGCYGVKAENIVNSLKKHRDTLSIIPKPIGTSECKCEGVCSCDDVLIATYEDKFQQIFDGIKRHFKAGINFEPSNSASFRTPMDRGGNREEIRSLFRPAGHKLIDPTTQQARKPAYQSKLPLTASFDELLAECQEYDNQDVGEPGSECSSSENEEDTFDPDVVELRLDEDLVNMVDGKENRGFLAPHYEDLLSHSELFTADKRLCDVGVVPLAEPLKVRIISKGDALNQYISKNMQKALWKQLRSHGPFRLIGEEVTDLHIHQLIEKQAAFPEMENFNQWVSGDYSAATDGLNMNYTKLAFETALSLIPKLSDRERKIMRSILYEQVLHYPKKVTVDNNPGLPPDVAALPGPYEAIQSNGQLMGSIVSFPILCAINIACYWLALEERTGKKYTIDQLPVLVNGDDILFRADNEFYSIWKKWVNLVGFSLSVGKNYIHPNILTVNSQTFFYKVVTVDDAGKPLPWDQHTYYVERVKWFNIGQCLGQSKHTGRSDERTKPIWQVHNEMIARARDKEFAHEMFLRYHKAEIRAVTRDFEYNLYLPFERGGLGFTPVTNDFHISNFQRRLAVVLEEEYKRKLKETGDVPRLKFALVNPREHNLKVHRRKQKPRLNLVALTDPLRKGWLQTPKPYQVLNPFSGNVEKVPGTFQEVFSDMWDKYVAREWCEEEELRRTSESVPIMLHPADRIFSTPGQDFQLRYPTVGSKLRKALEDCQINRMSDELIKVWPYRLVVDRKAAFSQFNGVVGDNETKTVRGNETMLNTSVLNPTDSESSVEDEDEVPDLTLGEIQALIRAEVRK